MTLICYRARTVSRAWQATRNDKVEKSRAKLLIVSNASDESNVLREYLQSDYALSIVGEGQAALHLLEQALDIDLVVLSGTPADMSDVALISEIRGRYAAGALPLIMLEDDGGPDEVARAFQVGADNCLTRPFTEAALKARVEALLALKRSFDQAQAKRAELEESEIHRLRIYRMASHDLQSPLANIRLAVKELERAAQGDRTDVNRPLVLIRQMAESIEDIMSSYLDVMELRAGRLSYHVKPVNLRDAVVNVLSQYEYSARRKQINLETAAAQGWVMADSTRLVQALGNLVSNAIKYSPHGSAVTIDTAMEPPVTWVTVTDQGPGILPTERDRLFQEFGKLSTQPTGGESRTGLGLWIVKQLIEGQHGVVRADFPATGGSSFGIGLPTASAFSAADS